FIMGIVPGMPHLAFLTLALAAASGAVVIYLKQKGETPAEQAAEAEKAAAEAATQTQMTEQELGWSDVTPVDVVGLEVGYRLIPMVDKNQGGQLLGRIKGIRKKLSQELGFLVPSVHIRDNLDLQPNEYRINLMGVNIGGAEIYPEREMAINPGQVYGRAQGIAAKDPAFGLDAIWIEPGQRDQVQALGYTVVDPSTVVATHMNTLLQKHAHELLGHDEVHELLAMLGKTSKKLSEELPAMVNPNILRRVLQNLLQEGIPVKDMRSIGEALAVAAARTQDPVALTSAVRVSLARVIVQGIYGNRSELPVMTLDPQLEQILLKAVQQSAQHAEATLVDDSVVIEPGIAERLQQALVQAAQRQEIAGNPAVLLVSAPLRPMLSRFVRYTVNGVKVLSYQEIPDNKQITIVAT